jgi:hypothetical protein
MGDHHHRMLDMLSSTNNKVGPFCLAGVGHFSQALKQTDGNRNTSGKWQWNG